MADQVVVVSALTSTPVVIGGPGVGPQGPQGETGGQYVHTQNTPASVWTINHNLGMKPNYTVIDSAGNQVEGAGAWPDNNTLIVTFTGSFSGTAFLS